MRIPLASLPRRLACAIFSIALASSPAMAAPPEEVTFSGPAKSPISAAVVVPAGRAFFLTSGTPPPLADEHAPAGDPARYGSMSVQAEGALRLIGKQLQEAGLSWRDVVYLRVYVAPDRSRDGKFDYQGWFDAYARFFGTPENPVKPARSTVGVASLVNPDWLIEIEAVAVYPAASTSH